MKKFMRLFVVVSAAILITGCGTAYMVSGDKEVSEIKSANDLYNSQIADYQDRIEDLVSDNNYLALTNPTSLTIIKNDSLISLYRDKISNLESISDDFLKRSAGKDKKLRIELKGFDPKEMAEAYMIVSYADNLKVGQQGGINLQSGLKGLLINTRNESVTANVSGPGITQHFIIKARGRVVFNLPMPGSYCITFVSTRNSNNAATILKEVGPTQMYSDEDGASFGLIATATSRF